MPDILHTDVLIVGGGPSGTSAALGLLLHTPFKVTLIDHSGFDAARVGEHVDASLFDLLSYLKIDKDHFEEESFIEGYSNLAAWGNETITSRNSIHRAEGKSYQLNREKFDLMMVAQVAKRGGQIFPRTKCIKMDQSPNGHWKIQLRHQVKGDFQLHAKFLIDASGRQGHICRLLNLNAVKHDQLIGVGAFLQFKDRRVLPQEVLLETVEQGWWYCATLPDQRMTVTLFTDADLVKEQQLQKPENWSRLLSATKHMRRRTENAFSNEIPWVRNAFSQLTDSSLRTNFLAVGDAAAAFDPISSMGIGFAVSSACNAARAAGYFLEGDDSFVKSYAQSLKDIFANYKDLCKKYYHLEQRWPDAAFWQRRL
ncbi:lysine-epsilon-oxidase maturase LodB [Pedobacter sp. L105]|uniref:lysine-epsilon-oxidase maturase LodB n=1 Tax=Pedobacter sp. L105 TaxID=1641871 RepID=UPI00131E42D3|nr:lysine-epsilon-oxidase maturase LodB [Pedobacter sp. L105]